MALTDIIAVLQSHAAGLSGVRAAPANPPESVNQPPMAVTFVAEMESDLGAIGFGTLVQKVTFHTLIFKSRQSLPEDVKSMTPYGDSFPAAVYSDPRLGGTVNTLDQPQTAKFGRIEYAGVEKYIGWTFETRVTLETPITVTVT